MKGLFAEANETCGWPGLDQREAPVFGEYAKQRKSPARGATGASRARSSPGHPVIFAIALLLCSAEPIFAEEPTNDDAAEAALVRGAEYLLSQQAKDGGWHSATYGQLKDGAGLTALVLDSLSRLPTADREKHRKAVDAGYDFFKPGFEKRTAPAAPDGTLDYPTYAAALWLTGHRRHYGQLHRGPLLFLLDAQLKEGRGFSKDHLSYGGWDFLGPDDAQGITTGSNVSLMANVLEALPQAEGDSQLALRVKGAKEAAVGWLMRCQQVDGGFCFTPEPQSLNNKAGYHDEAQAQARSYGAATADGIRALACVGEHEQEMQRAVQWLVDRPSLDVVPGFEASPPEADWQRGLRFYYYASLSRVLKHFPPAEGKARKTALIKRLLAEQREDGSWRNASQRMREDDPLIATSFAIIALGELIATPTED